MHHSASTTFVGSQQLQLKDEPNNLSFPVLVHYPTLSPSAPTNFGPFTMDVSPDAEIMSGQFPLVIISHGNSGSHLLYRTISTYLAQHGYIVAMLEHYGNNRNNNELEKSLENLQYRPRHVKLVIDHLLSAHTFGQSIAVDKIAVMGHSFGGYTALAVAGGKPWTKNGFQVAVEPDARVKALVLMAPAAAFYNAKGSLVEVSIPILLLGAEHDPFTPQKWTEEVILNGVPDPAKVKVQSIKNAGHFSFISPFPAAMTNANFRPSTDPEGFDRVAFHQQLPADILDFLQASW